MLAAYWSDLHRQDNNGAAQVAEAPSSFGSSDLELPLRRIRAIVHSNRHCSILGALKRAIGILIAQVGLLFQQQIAVHEFCSSVATCSQWSGSSTHT